MDLAKLFFEEKFGRLEPRKVFVFKPERLVTNWFVTITRKVFYFKFGRTYFILVALHIETDDEDGLKIEYKNKFYHRKTYIEFTDKVALRPYKYRFSKVTDLKKHSDIQNFVRVYSSN